MNIDRTRRRHPVRHLPLFAIIVAALAPLVACGNEYHPEYHPTTITHSSQYLSYPVTVQTGTQPAPVYVMPAPPPAPPRPAPQCEGPPCAW
jgi:hypothetical protein